MKVSRYADLIKVLSRYATTRTNVQGPSTAIGVQSDGITLKLIAATQTAGMIVTVPEDYTVDGKFAYYIEAKQLLDSSGTLPTKDTVTIAATKEGLSVMSSGGGVLFCAAKGSIKDVGFPKKPKTFKAEGPVGSGLWGQLSRIIPDVSSKVERPSIHTGDGVVHISTVAPGNRPRYATVALSPASGDSESLVTEIDFWEGLRALEVDGTLALSEEGILARAGGNECYSTILQKEFSWPVLGFKRLDSNVSITMERLRLIKAIKAHEIQKTKEQEGDPRVTLTVQKGMATFSPFAQDGSLKVPCDTTGQGVKSFNGEYMRSTLSSMIDSKHVTLEWGDSPAICVSAKEYEGWTLLVAPVALG